MKTVARSLVKKKPHQIDLSFVSWLLTRMQTEEQLLFSEPLLYFLKTGKGAEDDTSYSISAVFQTIIQQQLLHTATIRILNVGEGLYGQKAKERPFRQYVDRLIVKQGALQNKAIEPLVHPLKLTGSIDAYRQRNRFDGKTGNMIKNFYRFYETLPMEEKQQFLRQTNISEMEMELLPQTSRAEWYSFLETHGKELTAYLVEKQNVFRETEKEEAYIQNIRTLTNEGTLEEQAGNELEKIKVENTFMDALQTTVAEEKQTVLNWLERENATDLVLQKLTEHENTRELAERWLGKTPEKSVTSEKRESAVTQEDIREWISYLSEQEWQETRSVFADVLQDTHTDTNTYTNIKNFAEEKQTVLHWLERENAADLVLQKLTEHENTRELAERWFGKALEKSITSEKREHTATQEEILEWISYLSEQEWQETRSIFADVLQDTNTDTYTNTHTNIKNFAEEKQAVLHWLETENATDLVLQKLTEHENTRELVERWFGETPERSITSEKRESAVTQEDIREWISYLSEQEWQETRSVFADVLQDTDTHTNTYTDTHTNIRHFAEEKQTVLRWLERENATDLVLQKLTEHENTRELAERWFGKTPERSVTSEKRESTVTEEEIREWISYLSEQEWQEARSIFADVLQNTDTHTNTYTDTHTNIRHFAEEKQTVLHWLETENATDLVLQKLTEHENTRELAERWFGKTPERSIISETRESTVTEEDIREWISYLSEQEWQEARSVFADVLQDTDTYTDTHTNIQHFAEEKQTVLHWLETENATDLVLQKLTEHENTRELAERWFGKTPERSVTGEKREHTTTQEEIREWISYLSEQEWQETRSVFADVLQNTNTNTDTYTNTHTNIRHFAEEKQTVLHWLETENATDLVLQKLTEHENTRELAERWFGKTLERSIISEKREHTTTQEEIREWISYLSEQEWQETRSVFAEVLQDTHTDINNFTEENRTVLSWLEKTNTTDLGIRKQEYAERIERFTVALQEALSQYERLAQTMPQKVSAMEGATERNEAINRADDLTVGLNHIEGANHTIGVNHTVGLDHADRFDKQSKAAQEAPSQVLASTERMELISFREKMPLLTLLSDEKQKEQTEEPAFGVEPIQRKELVLSKRQQDDRAKISMQKDLVNTVQRNMQEEILNIQKAQKTVSNEYVKIKDFTKLLQQFDAQQKELEKLRISQTQILQKKDISILTEQVLQKMQRQLRMEKMRRGL